MTWLESDIAPALVQFGANWLLQSTLLITAGLLAAGILRQAALQAAIYRGTLLAVAAAPVVSGAIGALGLGVWSVSLLPTLTTSDQTLAAVSRVIEEQPQPTARMDASTKVADDRNGVAKLHHTETADPAAPAANDFEAKTSVPNAGPSWPTALTLAWLATSGLLLVRLAVAFRKAQRLETNSLPASNEATSLCRELSALMSAQPPAVLRSPFVAGPCLVGCRRPVILLPADQPSDTLRDVLIHELAHLRRRDGQWLLAERVLSAVLCFQPLLWLLARRLEAAAEAVCDDQVLALGGEATGYAQGLTDLAARNTTPVAMVAVGLFAQRSMLQHRVVRIMNAQRTLSTQVGRWPLVAVILVTTGLTVASGAIGAAPAPQAPADPTAPAVAADDAAAIHTIAGQITGLDGKPAAGVHVAAMATATAPERGGELNPRGEVLAEAVTDGEGRYRLEHRGSSQTHREAKFVARGPDTALAWKPLDLDAKEAEISLPLEPGETLVARLVDQQGQPAAGVQAKLVAIVSRVEGERFPEQKISAWWMKSSPQAWPQPVLSDAEGRIVLTGVPAGHGAYVNIAGTDRFAPQSLAINTGIPAERAERDRTYRSQVATGAVGAEPVARLEPAQVITGRVTYADTGLPAPHARLTISSSQQKFGSMMSVPGKADGEGRYRMSVMPGVQFGVTAYPPDGVPYLGREGERFDWTPADTTREFDITLPRGVVVQGRVLDGQSPVAGATVLYLPNQDTSRGKSNVLTGWQAIELTDAEGRYRINVLPGVGRLLVNAPSDDFVPKQVGSREIWEGKPGGERIQSHAIEQIDAQEGSPPIDLDVQLKRAGHASGQLVDQAGAPIDQALLFSSLLFDRNGGNWRGFPQELVGGHFQLGGMPADGKATVYFLEPKRKLGATVSLSPGENRQVALEPCGEATLRFVDAAGQPIPKHYALVEFVVTPGASRFDQAAANAGQLSADAMIIDNMDQAAFNDLATGEDGRLTIPALIPGGSYRVSTFHDGKYRVVKEFKAPSGEQLDLGDLTVERNKAQ